MYLTQRLYLHRYLDNLSEVIVRANLNRHLYGKVGRQLDNLIDGNVNDIAKNKEKNIINLREK